LELKAKSGELDGISELIDKIRDYLERIEIKFE
jgi:hypothetical protein